MRNNFRAFLQLVLLLIITASCKESPRLNKWEIKKFVYFRVYDLTYDSLNTPHLAMVSYFEYNNQKQSKVAFGKIPRENQTTTVNGLDSFFEFEIENRTSELIQKTLSNKTFDSTYNYHPEPRSCYFLYESSDSIRRVITFGTTSFPQELYELMLYLDKLMYVEYRQKPIEKFRVDSMVIDFEESLYLTFPPPSKLKIE